MDVKIANFAGIEWWLKATLLITTDDAGIRETADLIQALSPVKPPPIIETSPPPRVDIAKEKKKITDDCAHAITTPGGIYVQLDVDQNKHQPASVPIGTREIQGQKFGTYATKQWHEINTMKYMAEWAEGLNDLIEGKKREHGQSKRFQIALAGACCFEGFCMLLGGKKYVTFHCYPNSR